MVLVQDDDDGDEHVIYYLSWNLLDPEMRYAHVKKLVLAAVQVIQRFRRYSLLRTVTAISECNPMTYILSRQLLGGERLEVDRYAPRFLFGVYYSQIKEISCFR